jgi:HlyD family secretion protein
MTSNGPIILSCALAVGALLGACGENDEPDAYGNFKTTEVVVSAETGGRLIRFAAAQGAQLALGTVVAEIDTVTLALQRNEVSSQRAAAVSRTREVEAQVAVLQEELRTAHREYARQLRLKANDATTQQQVDQAEGQVRVITQRIAAVRVQGGTVADEAGTTAARITQIEKRIRDSRVVNPIAGTVLVTYAEAGEFVQPGQPLYKIANLDPIILRAYVTEDQLARVRIGARVQVAYDVGEDERRTVPGTVTFVSAQAEFTPTPIQTRDERADLVYAVEVRVPNPGGAIKIGMPGELDLPAAAPAAQPVAANGRAQQ